jgi:hypothetical protein
MRGAVQAVYVSGLEGRQGPAEGELAVAGGRVTFAGVSDERGGPPAVVEAQVGLERVVAASLEDVQSDQAAAGIAAEGAGEGVAAFLAAGGTQLGQLLRLAEGDEDGARRVWSFVLRGMDGRLLAQAVERVRGPLPAVAWPSPLPEGGTGEAGPQALPPRWGARPAIAAVPAPHEGAEGSAQGPARSPSAVPPAPAVREDAGALAGDGPGETGAAGAGPPASAGGSEDVLGEILAELREQTRLLRLLTDGRSTGEGS